MVAMFTLLPIGLLGVTKSPCTLRECKSETDFGEMSSNGVYVFGISKVEGSKHAG